MKPSNFAYLTALISLSMLATQALAQTAGSPSTTASASNSGLLSSNSSRGPIEITADALEVRQPDQVAVFTGNVLAIQGDLNLKADRMTVFYRPNEKKTTGQESISKIEVDGNVFLSNPTETARGNKGIYDVDANEIRLLGNVVLTRAENTLKGEALIYNMTSGKSVLTNAGKAKDNGKPERVRALFVPNKKEGN